MMHLILLCCALTLAWGIRWLAGVCQHRAGNRWQWTLGRFLFSPVLLVMTAIALVCMGPQGQMVRRWEGWFSYSLAVMFLGYAVVLVLTLAIAGRRSLAQVKSYPAFEVQNHPARLLPTAIPFIAQIGFWRAELVVSQGLLNTFDADHLTAVLTHEQAHFYYRDTFWFFWLGWLRRLTVWLPGTEALWQELLLLREQRADRWAAQHIDALLLAESLFQMVNAPELYGETFCAAFNDNTSVSRLEERINALLTPSVPTQPASLPFWGWLLLAMLPLAIVPFHH